MCLILLSTQGTKDHCKFDQLLYLSASGLALCTATAPATPRRSARTRGERRREHARPGKDRSHVIPSYFDDTERSWLDLMAFDDTERAWPGNQFLLGILYIYVRVLSNWWSSRDAWHRYFRDAFVSGLRSFQSFLAHFSLLAIENVEYWQYAQILINSFTLPWNAFIDPEIRHNLWVCSPFSFGMCCVFYVTADSSADIIQNNTYLRWDWEQNLHFETK